jgi:hypothetical protein
LAHIAKLPKQLTSLHCRNTLELEELPELPQTLQELE